MHQKQSRRQIFIRKKEDYKSALKLTKQFMSGPEAKLCLNFCISTALEPLLTMHPWTSIILRFCFTLNLKSSIQKFS